MIYFIDNYFGLENIANAIGGKIVLSALTSGTNEQSVDVSSSGMSNTFGTNCAYGASETVSGGANASSQDPQSSTGLGTVGTVISSCYACSSGGPEIIGVIFKEDAIPYTKVERNAKLTHKIISSKTMSNTTKVIIAPDEKTYTQMKKILHKNSNSSKCDNLEVLKKVLDKYE